jgi:FixJ family two-component response regulator
MPGMSGTKLAGRLPQLSVILVSGRDDARAAAKDYPNILKVVIKPYDKNDLMEAIREVMQSEKRT